MKKAKTIGKKTLSVFLAVLMVLTAWVWVAPTEVSAINAGTYDVKVKLAVSDTVVLDQDETDKLILYSKANNGSASSESTNKKTVGKEDLNTSSAEYEFTGVGFPTGVKLDNLEFSQAWNSGWGSVALSFEIYVKKNGTYTKIATSTSYSASESIVGGNYFTFDYDIPQTEAPKATKVIWDTEPSDFVISGSTVGKTHCVDQYGVTIGVNPTNSFTSTPTTGLSGSTSNGTAHSDYTISANNSARMSGEGNNSRDVKMTASYTFGGATVSDSKTFKINDPQYTVTINANGAGAGLTTTSAIERQYGDKYNVTPGATRTGFTLIGFYYNDHADSYETLIPNSTQLTSDTVVTETHTWYAAWQANQYKMKFTYRDENGNWITTDEVTEYFGRDIPFPDVTSPVDEGVDHTYTFTGWSPAHTTVQAVDGVTEYTAVYNDEPHYAILTGLEEQIRLADEKKAERLYQEGAYTPSTVAVFENMLKTAEELEARKPLLSEQDTVDSIAETLKTARENLDIKNYTVIFVDEDGTILKDGYFFVPHGAKVTVPGNPEKAADETYHYTFGGWDTEESDSLDACNYVTANLIYVASFNEEAHTFTETVTPSTCTEDGVITKTCTCGFSYTVAGETAGHKWSTDYKELVPATCATKGAEAKYCTACGAIDENTKRDIAELGHDFGAYTEYTPATCFGEGSEIAECSRCGGKNVRKLAQKTHAYGTAEEIEKTCTTDGYTKEVCTLCGFTNIRDIDKATGHSISTTTVDSTCVCSGYTKEECANCDYEKTTILPATGVHTFIDNWTTVSEATCVGHGVEKRVCTVCNAATETRLTDLAAHTEPADWTTEIEPWCDSTGRKVKDCTVCGKELKSETIAALNHNYEAYAEGSYAPTCTSAGAEAEKCSRCGDTNITVVQPLGHDWDEWTVEKAATNTEKGLLSRTCINGCGEKETAEIPAGGHSFNTDEPSATTDGTCLVKGTKAFKCSAHSDCGVTIIVETEFGAHAWSDWTKVDATNDTDGSWTRECAVCHTEETHVIPKGDHKFGDTPSSTVPATCKKTGTATYNCTTHTNCCVTITVVLEMIQHTAGVDKKDATCTENGYVKTYCTVCGDVISNVELKKTGHVETTTTRQESTCVTPGWEKVICKCGELVSEKELPLIAHNYDANGDGKVDKKDAVFEDGTYTYTCQQADCGHTITEDADDVYKVRFFDAAGNQIGETQNVRFGESAVAPAAPEKKADGTYHYEFSVWDRNYSEITSDLDVYPTYEKELHYGGEATCKDKALCDKCGTAYGGYDDTKHVMASKSTPATCEKDGVINYYCTLNCGYGYSEKIQKLNHNYGEWTVVQQGTCVKEHIQSRKCQNYGCDATEEYSTYKNHSWILEPAIAPTCTTVGYTEFKYCTVCNLQLDRQEVAKLSHNDRDGNGYCDYCGTSQGVPKCNCMCHSTGFMKIIYSIVRFFWIITKSSPSCSCGARHY